MATEAREAVVGVVATMGAAIVAETGGGIGAAPKVGAAVGVVTAVG